MKKSTEDILKKWQNNEPISKEEMEQMIEEDIDFDTIFPEIEVDIKITSKD